MCKGAKRCWNQDSGAFRLYYTEKKNLPGFYEEFHKQRRQRNFGCSEASYKFDCITHSQAVTTIGPYVQNSKNALTAATCVGHKAADS